MIGETLARYRVTGRLGAGGMGEVYRAEDTTLGREVAIKVLPGTFASDPERLGRFEREARLLASLNHPNIAQVYGFEEHDGRRFLVLELVEGEDLAERLARGPLPVAEAIEVAKQIAEALEEAHEKGIVHRDLKPANVKLTPDGRVKVLDFGLAKAWAGEPTEGGSSSVDLSQSPTLANAGTSAGIILGTAAYMSPEQARGKPVDRRADIWAFGVVLYEMLSGRQLFTGETISDVLAAVLTREIAWRELPAAAPSRVRGLLERCLDRNPRQRLRDIGEARLALDRDDEPHQRPPSLVAGPWGRLLLVVAGIVAGVGMGGLLPRGGTATSRTHLPSLRFTLEARVGLPPVLAIAPDGSQVAFNQRNRGLATTLWTQRLDQEKPSELEAVTGPRNCFWSPDGRRLAVATSSDFRIVDPRTGVTQRSFDPLSIGTVMGGTWSPSGVILVGSNRSILRLADTPAPPVPILAPREGESSRYGWPSFLPDGERFVFTATIQEAGQEVHLAEVASLESPGESRVLVRNALGSFWSNGHLIYGTEAGQLLAQPLDPDTLDPTGEPRLLAEGVSVETRFAYVAAAGSADGVVVYRQITPPSRQYVWVDAEGRTLGQASDPGPWHNFALSPDGTAIATTDTGGPAGNRLWLIEPGRGVTTELSAAGDPSISDPAWSPDGRELAIRFGESLVIRPARGGRARVLVNARAYPDSWSRDGRWLLYGQLVQGNYALFAREVEDPDAQPLTLVSGPRNADEPHFSPSGAWIAYHASGAAPATDVFVIPFPPTGERWQLSSGGGAQPRWSPDGEALFYLDLAGRLMRVATPGSDPRHAGTPETLFETRLETSSSFDQFEVAPDGRFLLQLPIEGADTSAPLHVLVGWDAAEDPR